MSITSAHPLLPHWIDGTERASRSGRSGPVFNPATGIVSAEVGLADESEIAEAIASAQRGFEIWSAYSIARRHCSITCCEPRFPTTSC